MTRSQRYDLRHPERRKASHRRYRLRNREKRNAQRRAWGKANREKIRPYQREWYRAHPRPRIARKPGRNADQVLEAGRKLHAAQAINISDSYVRGYLSSKNHIRNAPEALVDCVRTIIKIKRQIAYGTTEKHRRIARPITGRV